MIKEGYEAIYLPIISPCLYAERALAYGRKAHFRRQVFCDPVGPSEPSYTRAREYYGVKMSIAELFHTGVEVTPQVEHLEIRPRVEELGLPAETRCPDLRPLRQIEEFYVIPAKDRVPR